jgi:hypothetical protein
MRPLYAPVSGPSCPRSLVDVLSGIYDRGGHKLGGGAPVAV